MDIRPATVADLASIERLLLQCDLPIIGASDHLHNFVVAIDGSTMCGCGGVEHYGEAALLRSIAVAEHVRDAGLGRAIVSQLIARSRAWNVRSMVLLTTTAAGYFAHLGFERITRDQVPASVLVSSQFQGACPTSAGAMLKELTSEP
ncbi:arsenic resistance N-acetyltransferase ArsN2 [Burkholderia multivorans]|jgi:amino-acid N-acetyltransferase|uniref:GNAT family N-acetyltransferase n=1 Tax=Burkholderia multivorans TaxID=87883 RepID=A0A2S9MV17_9BURK|nr:arsenic resistance N-acetyltransferase ArsN2 [Burkholderia multivorans]MBU9512553.1 GNAT family N-acetyltransferase [Burkholderia multivorans]MBU9528416.1 GNAT family N-acetyltransferase [Burkholderia multivorans]MBU9638387.1 GNAT family N-acetyltransferase [Burkholderia multivorans]PRE98170.1 GNAT family N-acetyltransferase [Burkholderia multivorans]PRF63048.1 GNAT family N-acetyltransferase [Burkholderia multivorans]